MGRARTRQKRSGNKYKIFSLVFAMAIFMFPIVATAQWVDGMVFGNDPRKIVDVGSFKQRPADKGKNSLLPFSEPIVSITFDDGWESVYSAGMPVMQKYGIKSTQYILGGEFKNTSYLSEAQVKDMQVHGHELASHSMTHPNLTSLGAEELRWEIITSKELLQKKFKVQIKDFASPLGAENKQTLDVIGQYYRSQRNTAADPKIVGDEDVNTAQNFNRFSIIAYTVRSTTNLDEMKALIDYAHRKNAWVVLTYHQIDDSGQTFSVSPAQFAEQMSMLYTKPVRTATMAQVLDVIEKKRLATW